MLVSVKLMDSILLKFKIWFGKRSNAIKELLKCVLAIFAQRNSGPRWTAAWVDPMSTWGRPEDLFHIPSG